MRPHAWFVDELELREYRHTIELKVHASLVALQCWNTN
jgi:hypothetical protein